MQELGLVSFEFLQRQPASTRPPPGTTCTISQVTSRQNERHERHFGVKISPVTPTPHITSTHKTAGQAPFAAGSRIATHSTWWVIGNTSTSRGNLIRDRRQAHTLSASGRSRGSAPRAGRVRTRNGRPWWLWSPCARSPSRPGRARQDMFVQAHRPGAVAGQRPGPEPTVGRLVGADPRCGPALIALLNDDEPTVREWAAIALANLEIDGSCSAPPSPTQEWTVRPKQMSAGKALFLR